jgi:methyl-accepting chemotaxis protein
MDNFYQYIRKYQVKEILNRELITALDNILNELDKVSSIRSKVTSLSISSQNAISYYTKLNSMFLKFIAKTSQVSDDSTITYGILAYYNFLESKERAGIVRAVGSATFAADRFAKGAKAKISSLISEQKSYMDTFQTLATTKQKEYFYQTFQGRSIDEVDRMRRIMTDAKEIGGFNVDATYWFDTITKKLGLYKKTENFIVSKLDITDKYLENKVKIAVAMSNLLHETQKERGATAGFIGSKGKKFIKRLPKQRLLTNSKLAIFKQILSKYEYLLTQNSKHHLSKALQELDRLNSIRGQVDSFSIGGAKAIGYYTNMNGLFLDTIQTITKDATNAKEAQNMLAWYNFIMAKERGGIERAVMSNSFARNKFLPGMKSKFVRLITEQNSFLQSFKASATDEMLSFYKETVSGKYIDEVNRMRKIALQAKTIGGFGVNSSYWFDTITQKINLLKKLMIL